MALCYSLELVHTPKEQAKDSGGRFSGSAEHRNATNSSPLRQHSRRCKITRDRNPPEQQTFIPHHTGRKPPPYLTSASRPSIEREKPAATLLQCDPQQWPHNMGATKAACGIRSKAHCGFFAALTQHALRVKKRRTEHKSTTDEF